MSAQAAKAKSDWFSPIFVREPPQKWTNFPRGSEPPCIQPRRSGDGHRIPTTFASKRRDGMTQPSDQKPTSAPKPDTKSKQPALTELSPKELDQAAGGIKDIHFTKLIDKSSP